MKKSKSLCLALSVLVFLACGPSLADHMLCASTYITGLQAEHEKGLSVLGTATTNDPQKMSVYITIGTYHGHKALYVQSNYKPDQYDFPLKAAITEDNGINPVLDWIMGKAKPADFDTSRLTFYVEPSFFTDATYGKYQNQLTGKVVRLNGVPVDPKAGPNGYLFYLGGGDEKISEKDYFGALTYYQKAVQLNPGNALCHYKLGYCLYKQDLLEKSLPEFNKAIELDSHDFWAYVDRGRAYWKLNQLDKAMADFNKAVEAGPTEEDGYFNRGCLYRDLKEFDKALSDFNHSIQNKSTDPDAYFQRGCIYAQTGQYAEAATDYRQVLQLKPNYPRADECLKYVQAKMGNP